jgi:hypothetical protein
MANPTPQQNPNVAPQQKPDEEVMNLIKRKGTSEKPDQVQQVKSRLLKVIQTSGADPQKIIQAGKYAEMGLKSPQMYQMALDYAVKAGILTPDQLPKEPGIDYKLLANGITAGKLTQELIAEGKL